MPANKAKIHGIRLVGCGKMGNALLRGWIAAGHAANGVTIIDPVAQTAAEWRGREGIVLVAGPADLAPTVAPAVIVLAVKPQVMGEVVPAYRRYAPGGAVFLSIAAGKTLTYFANLLGPEAAIVRAMPNLPASIGKGATVLCANARVAQDQREDCNRLMAAVGEVAWVADETLLDAVTAVSGSGPAYVFLLAECLAEAGIAAGLPTDLAHALARATVAGSGALLQESHEAPAQLRQSVTSPGGTTAAALSVLMAPGAMTAIITRAVAAATARSRELAR